MRGRFYINNEIQKLAADLINFKCPIDVSSPDLGIDLALGNERSIHAVPTNHSVGRRVCHRKGRSVGGIHDAPH